MEKINVEGLARLPAFSHAVVAGDTIYVSGSLGTLSNTMELSPGGAGPETRQILDNISAILEGCGATLDDVVKVSVYVTDMGDFAAVNEAYLESFGGSPPARTTVGVAELALGAAVEMDAIARKPSR